MHRGKMVGTGGTVALGGPNVDFRAEEKKQGWKEKWTQRPEKKTARKGRRGPQKRDKGKGETPGKERSRGGREGEMRESGSGGAYGGIQPKNNHRRWAQRRGGAIEAGGKQSVPKLFKATRKVQKKRAKKQTP